MTESNAAKVAYLGPKYTFSHEAAMRMYPGAELFYSLSFKEVFMLVQRGEMDYAVLPIENSSTGAIPETCQLLLEQNFEPLTADTKVKIVKEFYLPVKMDLLARGQIGLSDIKTLYTHRQPQLQCSDYIAQYLPGAKIENTVSTAEAAEKLLQDASAACIGSDVLAREMKLTVLQAGIQDMYRNVTRFVGLSTKYAASARATKTTFAIVIPDRPGMLVEALQLVSSRGINVRNIKTLPVRDSRLFSQDFKDWFVLDIEAASTSAKYKHLHRDAKEHSELILSFKYLGSYPTFATDTKRAGAPPKKPKPISDKRAVLLALLEQADELESEKAEFKSTLRFNIKTSSADKELPKAVAKSICSFMNADGGTVFIGVGDHKEPVGIEKDVQSLAKKDEDGFVSAIYQLVIDTVGIDYCSFVRPNMLDYKGKRICALEVETSVKPAWFNDGSNQTFYVRIGNASRPLQPKEALDYILRRFKGM